MHKKVAVVIPTHKTKFNHDDLISLRHLKKYLNRFDKYFVVPEKIDEKRFKQNFKFLDAKIIRFEDSYFKDWRGYNELLLQREFYEKFKEYEYILIYQLDVLVFSDKLLEWCKKGYDYVAAPWFRPVIGKLSHKKGYPASGGNGGFSLRKVKSALRVLNEIEKSVKRQSTSSFKRKLWFISAVLGRKSHDKWLEAPADNYPFAEDGFWSLEAPKYLADYKVPDFKEALKFAFERFPKKSFKLNNNQLPFGVHAWKKYGEKFWRPYIIKK